MIQYFLLFIAKSHVGNQNKKALMFFLPKEASTKDQQLKSQTMISFKNDDSKKAEYAWKENGFFNDQRSDLTILKPNFPENTLVYVNQVTISAVKDGHAIYLEFVITDQIMLIANPDPEIDLDKHDFKDHEALFFVPLYNTSTGLYRGLTKKLAHITLRGDVNERFYSYGYSKENKAPLFCPSKQPMPNIFHCIAFKKHQNYLLDENLRCFCF